MKYLNVATAEACENVGLCFGEYRPVHIFGRIFTVHCLYPHLISLLVFYYFKYVGARVNFI